MRKELQKEPIKVFSEFLQMKGVTIPVRNGKLLDSGAALGNGFEAKNRRSSGLPAFGCGLQSADAGISAPTYSTDLLGLGHL